jgi:hypothetical protein
MLVEQHLIYDVVSGVVWAFMSWRLAAVLYLRRRRPELSPLQNLRRVLGLS